MSERATPETDAFITSQDYYPTGHQWRNFTRKLERERDEARELCRELVDLVAYGLGQSGEPWSADAMRQARETIQKAKALEAK